MRILHVNQVARRAGGAEVFLFDLLDWLREKGHVTALVGGDAERSEVNSEFCFVKRPEWDGDRLLIDEEFERATLDYAREFEPDLIHVHNLATVPVRLLPRLAELDVPLVHHVHDASTMCANAWVVRGDGSPCPSGVGAQCLEHGCEKNYPYDGRILTTVRLRAMALRSTMDAFITSSEAYAGLCRTNGFEPVTAIPYWAPSAPVEPPPPTSDKRVLFLGRLVPEKGVETLLDAWPEVVQRVPDAILDVVGDGPLRDSLEARARSLGLDPAKLFRGRIPHDQVHETMQRSTALVFPSIWMEAFGIISHESFHAGTPVVASKIGGIPEVVTDGSTGLLVEPRDPQALAAAIVKLLTDDALHARLQKNCLARAEELREDTSMHRVLEVYEQARSRGTSHRRPVDLDLLASANRLFHDFGKVESWALGMKGHIDYLEANGEAGNPVKSFAKHVAARLRSKLGR